MSTLPSSCDVAIVGAGAAGLATAIFARRFNRSLSVVLLEGARRPGAKILVSGGARCNVTNAAVTAQDFWGGPRTIVRNVLRAFPVSDTIQFFLDLGVRLHEEAGGKLFPDSNRARDVLDALLRETAGVGATLVAGERVHSVERATGGFRVVTTSGSLAARNVVLAAGGQSLPKAGATDPASRSRGGSGTRSFRPRPRSCRSCWRGMRQSTPSCRGFLTTWSSPSASTARSRSV